MDEHQDGHEAVGTESTEGRRRGTREPIENLVPLRKKWWPESFTLIRDAADTFDWTLTELAERMGYGHNQIWRKSRTWDAPNTALLLKLSDAVQLPMSKVVASDFSTSPLILPGHKSLDVNAGGAGILALLFAQTPAGDTVRLQTPLLQQVQLRRSGAQEYELVLDTVAGPLMLKATVAN